MRPQLTSRTASVTQSILFLVLASLLAGCASPLQRIFPSRPPNAGRTHLVAEAPSLTERLPRPRLETPFTLARADLTALEEEPPAEAPSCPPEGTRVLVIGDSLSHGLAPHVRRHARACGTPYFAHGVIGSHVTQWAHPSWLRPQLERARPTVVLVSLGGNDFQRRDVEKVRAGIETFITAVHEADAELLWIAPPTMPFPDTAGVRGMWADAVARHDVPTFAADALDLPRVADRIHPTRAAHAELAGMLWSWLAVEMH